MDVGVPRLVGSFVVAALLFSGCQAIVQIKVFLNH